MVGDRDGTGTIEGNTTPSPVPYHQTQLATYSFPQYLEKRSCQLFYYCVHMARKNDIAMLRKFLRKVLGISLRLRKSLRKVLGIRSTNAW